MSKIIILMQDGAINGVYSDNPVNLNVSVCDADDEYSEERSVQYHALRYQIHQGGLRQMLQPSATQEVSQSTLPSLDPNVFCLIRDPNVAKTEAGQEAQRLSAAFIDGYLSASAALSSSIFHLYRSKHPDAAAAYHALAPLLDQQSQFYDQLCEKLNQAAVFDEVGYDEPASTQLSNG